MKWKSKNASIIIVLKICNKIRKKGEMMTNNKKQNIAVLIPCYNEEQTVSKTVKDFKKALPEAKIYVYNNNSKDKTAELAKKAGAIVRNEYQQGKGNVVRSMFRDIDADIYVLVDGDDTYPAKEAGKLIKPVEEGRADMVIGDRLSSTYYTENKRPFHNFGNDLVRNLVNFLFKAHVKDIMTGYRVFSKKFVKCMPIMSDGFQIETEMTVFSLVYHMNIVEIPITYKDRPEGSVSKLNTYKDGFKVLMKLFDLFKDYRPFMLFGIISIISLAISIIVLPINIIVGIVLLLFALLMFTVGIILDAIKNEKQYLYMVHMNQIIKESKK